MMSSLNLHEVRHSATPTDVTKHVIEILLVEATRPLRRRSTEDALGPNLPVYTSSS